MAAVAVIDIKRFGDQRRRAFFKRDLDALRKSGIGGRRRVDRADRAIGEFHPRDFAILLARDATVPGMHDAFGEGGGEKVDEVGAVHAEGRVPAR